MFLRGCAARSRSPWRTPPSSSTGACGVAVAIRMLVLPVVWSIHFPTLVVRHRRRGLIQYRQGSSLDLETCDKVERAQSETAIRKYPHYVSGAGNRGACTREPAVELGEASPPAMKYRWPPTPGTAWRRKSLVKFDPDGRVIAGMLPSSRERVDATSSEPRLQLRAQ